MLYCKNNRDSSYRFKIQYLVCLRSFETTKQTNVLERDEARLRVGTMESESASSSSFLGTRQNTYH